MSTASIRVETILIPTYGVGRADKTPMFLENDYIRVMVLPELGGRIQRAMDKRLP